MHDTAFTLDFDFPTSAEEVWRYLTLPELLERWYWPTRLEPAYEIDAVVGGRFRFASEVANMAVSGTYLEVAAPRRFEKSWRWDGAAYETRVRVVLSDREDSGTRVTLTHSGHEDVQSLENHRVGWTDCLSRLKFLLDGSD